MATSYANPGGTGDRTSSITMTTTATTNTGTFSKLIDGAIANDYLWNNNQTGREIKFDFGVSASKVIDECKWYQSATHTQGTWVVEGSDDNIRWTRLSDPFTLGGGTPSTHSFTNTDGYRYYKIRQINGVTSASSWLQEIEFKIDSGSAASPDPNAPNYDNIGGRGDRSSVITVTTTATTAPSSGSVGNLVDGVLNTGATQSWAWVNAQTGREIKFDFGAGAPKIITEFKWWQSTTAEHGTWKLQGSNNNADWVDIGASFTLGGATESTYTEPSGNTNGYRYYRLLQTAGATSSTPWLQDIEFKIADGGPAIFYIDGDELKIGISNPTPGSYPLDIKITDAVSGAVTKPFTIIVS